MDTHTVPTAPRLYRSRKDRVLGGVCSGLGQYFALDPVVLRLAFVLLAFAGMGILAYLILWIIVPERPLDAAEPAYSGPMSDRSRMVLAGALVIFGVLVLASNLRLVFVPDWGQFWPLVLIVVGVALLVRRAEAT